MKLNLKKSLLLCLCLSTLAACNAEKATSTASSSEVQGVVKSSNSNNDPKALIKSNMEKLYPQVKVKEVNETVLPGLYEVVAGSDIVYVTEGAKQLFVGDMIDTASKQSLTAERLKQVNAIDVKSLPLDKAIKEVKGNGKRELIVFSDPDCPYCKVLEKDLEKLKDVTIYTFLYPLRELHPDAEKKSRQIWCSANKKQAWKDWMLREKAPSGSDSCENPIAETIALGQKLNINGTPAIIFANGEIVPGALNAEQIEAVFQKNSNTKK